MKRLSMLSVLAALAIYAWLAWSFRGYTPDDTFIYLRYADNWAAGRGLVFNPGERVQGYTSPLWTLLIGLASSAGVSSLAFAKMAGAIVGAGCIAMSHLIAKRFDARAGALGRCRGWTPRCSHS
jgi:arabinofuranosyltransferase